MNEQLNSNMVDLYQAAAKEGREPTQDEIIGVVQLDHTQPAPSQEDINSAIAAGLHSISPGAIISGNSAAFETVAAIDNGLEFEQEYYLRSQGLWVE